MSFTGKIPVIASISFAGDPAWYKVEIAGRPAYAHQYSGFVPAHTAILILRIERNIPGKYIFNRGMQDGTIYNGQAGKNF